jgi:hypothetical protein
MNMINRDADSFLEHSRQIYSLAESLSQDGIAVYEHSYDMLSFGSWFLILGKRKSRLRFTWDGKDGVLKTEKALIPDSRSIIKWKDISFEFDGKSEGENIFKSIEDFIRKKFEAQQINQGDGE